MAETELKSLRVPREILLGAAQVAQVEGIKQAQVLVRWLRVGSGMGVVTSGRGAEFPVGAGGLWATPETTVGVIGQRVVRVEDQWGKELTKEQVDAMDFGLPGPGEIIPRLPDPGFGTEGKIMRDPPKGWFDPQLTTTPVPLDLPVTKKITRKIRAYVDGVEQEKKIASVPASVAPTPVFEPPPKIPVAASGFEHDPKIPVAASGFEHDPATCRMYGCLMCKLAKGEK